MIIHHYCPRRKNIGDDFVINGIHKQLRRHFPDATIELIPVNRPHIPAEYYGLRGPNLERSNRQADLIVIGGSNLYQCRKNGQWGVVTDLDSIKQIKKPVLLVGIGCGSSFNTIRTCSDQSRAEMIALNQIAIGSSVRDRPTVEYLKAFGIRNMILTGCPATFVFDQPFCFRHEGPVAISVPSAEFGKKKRLAAFFLTRSVQKYIRHCRQQGFEVVLSCHHERDLPLAARLAPACPVVHSLETQPYYDLYNQARYVVGFRLHSTIISLSLGTPFIPVSFDLRGEAFVQTYQGENWNIEGFRNGLYPALIRYTQRILNQDPAPFEPYLNNRKTYRETLTRFFDDSLARL